RLWPRRSLPAATARTATRPRAHGSPTRFYVSASRWYSPRPFEHDPDQRPAPRRRQGFAPPAPAVEGVVTTPRPPRNLPRPPLPVRAPSPRVGARASAPLSAQPVLLEQVAQVVALQPRQAGRARDVVAAAGQQALEVVPLELLEQRALG